MGASARGKRVLLTGGAGFLGAKVRDRLEAAGAAEVFVPRRAEFDLTGTDAVARAYSLADPDTVIHLAAEVGGGTGSASREFLYVDDCADEIVAATERYDGPEPINVGAAREIRVRELTELIAPLTGFEGRLAWDPSRPDGQPCRALDPSRAREAFGLVARTTLEHGLARTVAWYRESGAQEGDVVRHASGALPTG